MNRDAYELLALTARYFFTGLMLLIVLRAARGAAADSRKAGKLRRLSPMTGVCGELKVIRGEGRAKTGMRYSVIREGMIGSSRRADVRILHGSVRRRHAFFQLTDDGLEIRTHAGAKLRGGEGDSIREGVFRDGDCFEIGNIRLMLVLSYDAPQGKAVGDDEWDDDDFDDAAADELFEVADDYEDSDDSWRETTAAINPIFEHTRKTVSSEEAFGGEDLSPIFREGWNEARMRRRQEEQRGRRGETEGSSRARSEGTSDEMFDVRMRRGETEGSGRARSEGTSDEMFDVRMRRGETEGSSRVRSEGTSDGHAPDGESERRRAEEEFLNRMKAEIRRDSYDEGWRDDEN